MFASLPKGSQIGDREFRRQAFAGSIYRVRAHARPSPAAVARHWLAAHCGADLDALSQRWRAQDWPVVQKVQQAFSESGEIRAALLEFLQEIGSPFHVGNARLRVVCPDGHLVPRAAPAYLAHRDTWFANSQSQLNWWMPLVTVEEATSFGFCPELFETPVENNSARFNYRRWMAGGGFQREGDDTREYPTTSAVLSPRRFRCELDEIVCFSAAHLHQTLPVHGSRARMSLDFRSVADDDLKHKRSAPNVDNRSVGDATLDYQRCESPDRIVLPLLA